MSNWYYYNKNGEKVGPITVPALKALAMQGLIMPETVIENGNGRSCVAENVNGLTFLETAVPPDEVSFGPLDKEEVYGLASSETKIPPPVEPNPFTAAVPVESNPFVVTIPVADNPFTAAMPQTVSVQMSWKLPKLVIIGGIVCVLFLLVFPGWLMLSSPRFTAEERDAIDLFCADCAAEGIDMKTKDELNVLLNGTINELDMLLNEVILGDGNIRTMLGDRGDVLPIIITKYLVSKGADVNAKNNDGATLLHYCAALSANVEVTKFLVSKGADVNAKDNNGETPLDFAKKGDNTAVVEYLESLMRK